MSLSLVKWDNIKGGVYATGYKYDPYIDPDSLVTQIGPSSQGIFIFYNKMPLTDTVWHSNTSVANQQTNWNTSIESNCQINWGGIGSLSKSFSCLKCVPDITLVWVINGLHHELSLMLQTLKSQR